MTDREYDIVLFGATGFTGVLVAEQLAQRAPEGLTIALAGRSLAKLGEVREQLPARAADWPLVLADAADRSSINGMARSTRVLVTTVGPYLKHGLPLVAACAKAGTHYLDLTGEVPFMRASIDACHDQAVGSGARIVHACGFDSIPSDLGVLTLHEAAGALGPTTLLVKAMKGGFSGGTAASMRAIMEAAAGDAAVRATLKDPYSLSPDRDAEPDRLAGEGWPDESDLTGAHHDPELGWLGPFVMAQANTRVVRRSNALSGYAYSTGFRYQEAMSFGEGVAARAKATGYGAGLGALTAAMGLGPARAGAELVLPKPGEGPSAEARESGHFRMELYAHTGEGGRLRATVAAQGDPGYAATSVMLAEAALTAALDEATLPDAAGVLTPATGLGIALVERLRGADFTFEVGPWEPLDEAEPEQAGEGSGEPGSSEPGSGDPDEGPDVGPDEGADGGDPADPHATA
jgi:short subunit dehydrogenase-like uncharacterized protein